MRLRCIFDLDREELLELCPDIAFNEHEEVAIAAAEVPDPEHVPRPVPPGDAAEAAGDAADELQAHLDLGADLIFV